MQEGELKVPFDIAVLMVGIAVFFDLLDILSELIPFAGVVIGFVIDLIMTGIYFLWLGHYEIRLFSDKNAAGSMIAFTLNALPFTDLTFPWAIRISSLVFFEKKQAPKQVRPAASGWRL